MQKKKLLANDFQKNEFLQLRCFIVRFTIEWYREKFLCSVIFIILLLNKIKV